MAPVLSQQGQIDFPVRKLRSSSRKKVGAAGAAAGATTPLPEASPVSPVKKKKSSSCSKSYENILKSPLKAKSPSKALNPLNALKSPKKSILESRENLRFSPEKRLPSPRKSSSPLSPCSALEAVSLGSSPPPPPSSARSSLSSRLEASLALQRPSLSHYKALKAALRDESLDLCGRDKQLAALRKFFDRSGRSLYVSGAPGTGKTACLKRLLASELASQFPTVVFVNCMTLQTPANIFAHIRSSLSHAHAPTGKGGLKHVKEDIEDLLTHAQEPILLCLDEMDQLESKNQDILYTLFEWPFLQGSRLTLVGIANALDLTDRILPRLKLRAGICPQQLSFPAYSRQEITDILNDRISIASDENTGCSGNNNIIQPNAVKFLAGKIGALSGDIRKALDVLRRAVEIVELQARKQSLLTAGPPPAQQPSVGLPLILKIVNEVYGSKVSSSLKDSDSDLPLVQKLLVASLLLMTTTRSESGRKAPKEVPFSRLYRTYVNLCRKRNMAPVPESEIIAVSSLLDARGLIALRQTSKKKSAEPRLAQVSLRIDEKEVEAALQDKTLLSDILNDVACIAK